MGRLCTSLSFDAFLDTVLGMRYEGQKCVYAIILFSKLLSLVFHSLQCVVFNCFNYLQCFVMLYSVCFSFNKECNSFVIIPPTGIINKQYLNRSKHSYKFTWHNLHRHVNFQLCFDVYLVRFMATWAALILITTIFKHSLPGNFNFYSSTQFNLLKSSHFYSNFQP